MTDSFEKRGEAFEEQLDAPPSEILLSPGQGSDLLLLGRVAEAMLDDDDPQRIIERFLEHVSTLKDLPYAAHFQLDDGKYALRAEYSAILDTKPSGARLTLPADIDETIFKGEGPSRELACTLPAGCLTFEAAKFEVGVMLAQPFIIRNRPRGLLLFADRRRNPRRLRALLPVLREMTRILHDRLDHLAFERELSDTNRMLEESLVEHHKAQVSLQQTMGALENTGDGVIITDSSERITAVNRAFTEITGYEANDVIGKTPRILRSGRHDRAFYATMWRSIQEAGRWQGEIWNRNKDGSIYPELLNLSVVKDETGAVMHYIGVFSDLSAMKESEARFQHLVHFDVLTGLPNRLLFQARVEHAIEQARTRGRRVAVMLLGIDGFKHLNESLGHPSGDELLRQLAERLRGLTRESNTVARRSGDEFGILIEGVTDPESAGRAGWNMLEGIASPFEVDGQKVFLTCSAGISIYPDDGTDFTTLLQNAEVALHRAKGLGSGKYQFYTADMTERAYERFVVESDLRRAVQRREFILHFQPQISLDTGGLTGVEALARWQHPERGLIAPSSFIPIAEETGLIDSLGAWAVREACDQAVAWQAEGLPALRVAVNLSTRQIANPRLVETVASALRDTGLAAEFLELEITEGFLMERPEEARKILQQLKDLGVALAIDDFGTGYSSLSYLKIYPVDRLKIDQSFVRDIHFRPDDQAIARAVITLGHGLSLKVIAEGVETEAQAEFLRVNHCDEVQGYFYGQPMPADAFGDFLRKWA